MRLNAQGVFAGREIRKEIDSFVIGGNDLCSTTGIGHCNSSSNDQAAELINDLTAQFTFKLLRGGA